MVYAIIYEDECGVEKRKDVLGTPSLEKFTDDRIVGIYGTMAKHIYKVYPDSRAVILL